MTVREPVSPIVKSHAHNGSEYDVQTVDRGVAHHCIVTNLFFDGQLLITRTVPYLEKAPPDYVKALMDAHHTRLIDELAEGALDEEIKSVLNAQLPRVEGTLPSAAPAKPPATPPIIVIKDGTPRTVVMTFQAPPDFLAVHNSRGQHAGLLVEDPLEISLGEKVEMILRFAGNPMRQFVLEGQVAWRRRKNSETLKAGFGVDFPQKQKVALEHVVEFALGIHDVASMRQHPRVRCALPIRVIPEGGKPRAEKLGDLSAGGMFIPTAEPLGNGAAVTVELKPQGWWFALKVRGVVVWSRQAEPRGMGVKLTLDGGSAQKKLGKLVESLMKV